MQRVKGAKEFGRLLDKHVQDVPRVLESAMYVGAQQIQGEAARLAPYLTGNLRRSIHTVTETKRGEVRAVIGTNVEYATFQEYGTSKMAPNPFLRPALDTKIKNAIADATEALRVYFRRLK